MNKMLEVRDESGVYDATVTLLHKMQRMGFNSLDCNMAATSLSEIGTNAIKYAGSGKITIELTENKKGLEIIVEDKGPGIDNKKKALEDGFTTRENTSLGVGLGVAKRAMDYFRIVSRPGQGTKIKMRKYMTKNDNIEFGVVSLPDIYREVNGDDYFIKEFEGDKIMMSVIDGLGEGINARRSALIVKKVLEESYSSPLDVIMRKCDRTLKKKNERGAAVSILLLKKRTIHYAVVGDTFANVYPKTSKHLRSHPGIVGTLGMPTVPVIKTPYQNKDMIIILCTDGIRDHFSISEVSSNEHAQDIANYIMQHYRRRYGDATVLVAKITSQ